MNSKKRKYAFGSLESPDGIEKSGRGRIPVRYILTFLLFIGSCLCIMMRVSINIAIVAMVRKPSKNISDVESYGNETWSGSDDMCPIASRPLTNTDETIHAGTFDWSQSMQGVVIGGFYYGCMCSQLISGRLSEKFGPKFIYIIGMFGSSVMNMVFPMAAEYSFALNVATRILTGIFQAFSVVSTYYFVAKWYPTSERGFHLALVLVGQHVGNVITMPVVAYLCQYGFAGGWPSAFYLFGAIGLLFCFPTFLLTSNRPDEHPMISKEELAFIQSGAGKPRKAPPIPWFLLLRSVPVWTLCVLRFTSALAFHLVQSKVPTYLDSVLQFPIQYNGLINSGFYFFKALSGVFSGKASDVLIRRGTLTVNMTRKVFQSITMLGASLCLIAVPLSRCESIVVVVLLTLCMTLHGFQNGGEMPVAADLAPAFSGTLFGITNAFASGAGMVAPSIAGVFLDGNERSLTSWSYVFYLTAGICTLGCLVFLLLGSANRLSWGKVEVEDENPTLTSTETVQSTRGSVYIEKERY